MRAELRGTSNSDRSPSCSQVLRLVLLEEHGRGSWSCLGACLGALKTSLVDLTELVCVEGNTLLGGLRAGGSLTMMSATMALYVISDREEQLDCEFFDVHVYLSSVMCRMA